MVDYSFIVCSNGYGHIKRVISVANAILNQQPNVSIAIIAKPELIAYVKDQPNFNWNPAFLIDTTATEFEPDWKQAVTANMQQAERWAEELTNNHTLQHSKTIVSDNHVTPLAAYPNAILMGSFFWHQIFPSNDTLLIDSDNHLLNTLHPKHLCLADMVMPEAAKATQAIGLPWFCKRSTILNRPSKQVLITGGGTSILNHTLLSVVATLQQHLPEWQVWVDSKLKTYCTEQGYSEANTFSFTEDAFAQLEAIVCRPGIGILTDCIQYNIPAFTVVGESNAEIKHNGKQFEAKGYGLNHIVESDVSLLDDLIPFLSNTTLLQQIRQHIGKAQTDGALAAALYLLNIHHDE
jgi:hypothetical protein